MLKVTRKILVILFALLTSFILLVSIPLVNLWIKGDLGAKKYTKTAIALTSAQPNPEPQESPKSRTQPKRTQPTQRSVKSGPRFAMDLGVAGGSGGATISTDILKNAGGGNANGSRTGDVDEKPSLRTAPSFQAPQQIRESEVDANLLLSFCVDERGRAYDIRVVEETPTGKGLAQAGKEALAKAQFAPAQKDGKGVAFCGMEQPFEVRFRE